MTTSIGVEHVAPHVREWTCRRIVRCPPYADENTEQQNARTPTECTNNVLAFKDSDIYLQNIKLQKYFVHTYEPKTKVSILLNKSSTNFMLNSLGLFSLPYTLSFKFTHRLRLQ